MKTILVPTDFSECANNALHFAGFLAAKTEAQLVLIHVLEVPEIGPQGSIYGTVDDIPYMMDLLKATRVKMKKLAALPFLKKIRIMHNIETGNVVDKIINASKKYNADLIVTGTHGSRGIQELLIGSTAEQIVRSSQIPVITIKHAIDEPRIDKIVFATDLSPEAEIAFPTVEKIAKLFGASIDVVKVVTKYQFESTKKSENSLTKFKRKFKDCDFSASVYYDLDKVQGIRKYAKKIRADLIVLCTHGRHGLSHFFRGSVAGDILNTASIPVLTINLKYEDNPDVSHTVKKESIGSFEQEYYRYAPPVI